MADLGGSGTTPGRDAEPSEPAGAGRSISPGAVVRRRGARTDRIVVAGRALSLFVLPDPDALLDALTQEEFDRNDGRMPYWATLWPSAFALAEAVLTGPSVAGRRVLDLGCGLGLCGLAALERGARVTFLDWEPDAVALATASAHAAGGSVEAVACDWRAPPPLPPFDLVLGADVLYEERNGPAVAVFLARHLAPRGEAWVADPGRRHAERFPDDVRAAGLAFLERRALPPRDDAKSLVLWRVGRA
ncbi:MAG: methyltransferase domain-containing protein [Planctomycetes bacterium]|nr:methyltransferase domain-containing protein [Planctomycetota bacterium]